VETITISRPALVEAMVSELLEFFDDPRSGGSTLHESEARWIIGGAIERALQLG
jgi:hypothetical protein